MQLANPLPLLYAPIGHKTPPATATDSAAARGNNMDILPSISKTFVDDKSLLLPPETYDESSKLMSSGLGS
jgi:hypothetical protein